MDSKDWKLWNNITFKTQGYRKNFDFVNDDENIITEYEGSVSEVRIAEQKPPIIVGEYGFSIWNIDLGLKFGVNFDKLIKEHAIENTYAELRQMILKKEVDIHEFKKVVLIHTFILRKDYRKRGITEELIEMFYRDFYCKNTAIIALIKPFQDNPIDADFYYKRKSVMVKESIKPLEVTKVPAFEYYQLNEFMEKTDRETNEYKLFSIGNKCGFSRIDGSYLFTYSPDKTVERMMAKREYAKINEKV
jgi:hypothetical protein